MSVLKRLSFAFLLVLLSANHASAQVGDPGGGEAPVPQHAEPMTEVQREALIERLSLVMDSLRTFGKLSPDRGASVQYSWPLRSADHYERPSYFGISNFVDQNPAFPNQILDYTCGARTYDLPSGYNHRGTDFFTWPYGWALMDDDAVEVVAAADGVIVLKEDGHYDRQCTMSNAQWNAVYVGHDDGSITWYGHLKKGSLTTKEVGETVEKGEFLGIVGSSGSSTGPHLHWEVYDPASNLVDPYAGSCNSMNAATLWEEQPEYYLPALNAIITHSEAPTMPTCPDTQDNVNESTQFERGDIVYTGFYYRDQLAGEETQYRLLRPSGTALYEWSHSISDPHYAASYWYWALPIPPADEEGTYVIEASFAGEIYTHSFNVGTVIGDEPGPEAAALTLDVFPNPAASVVRVNLRAAANAQVDVRLYDLLGREVMTLQEGTIHSGNASVTVDVGRLATGSYIVRATSNGKVAHQRLAVVR